MTDLALTTTAASDFPASDMLPVQPQATVAFRIARALIAPLVRTMFRFDVSGLENLPSGPCVIIANHLNWVDSFSILLNLPVEPRIHFIGDPTELRHRRFQWWVVRHVGGFVPVDRSHHQGPQLFDHVERCLERGGVIALYPEGRYGTEEGSMLPFKKGFAHFAHRADVSVVPVALTGHRDLWWRKRLGLRVGRPIASTGRSVDELCQEGEAALTELLPSYTERRGLHLFAHRLTTLL